MANLDTVITIEVNGEPQTCSPVLLPDLLEQMGLDPRLVAVEYNGEILHRQHWSHTRLQEGDRLEVVTIVGGGSRCSVVRSATRSLQPGGLG